MDNNCITITFCEAGENHVGMEIIGNKANIGYSYNDLLNIYNYMNKQGIKTDIYDLRKCSMYNDIEKMDEAYILVIKNGVDYFLKDNNSLILNHDTLKDELLNLNWDKKAKMFGRVVNKRKRHNLCFADYSQSPDYANGKGTIINFNSLPILSKLRNEICDLINHQINDSTKLIAEGNLYYDIEKCGIKYHGDTERRKVIGVRLGKTIPLIYSWFNWLKPIGSPIYILIEPGDIYIMSDKATGHDWVERSKITLRHAAGSKDCISLDKY